MADQYQCRICLEDHFNPVPFIAPCLCNGSSKYVHRKCLDEWRSQNPDGANFLQCNTCKFEYELIILPQDPDAEKKRRQEYNNAVSLSVVSIIFYTIIVTFTVSFIFYLLDCMGLTKIHKRFSKYIPGPPPVIYSLAAIICTFFLFGVIGICIFFGSYISALNNGNPEGNILVHICNMNLLVLLFIGFVLGFISGFYYVYRYLDIQKRHHKQRIWFKKEATIKQVRNFGVAGPPRAPPPPLNAERRFVLVEDNIY